MSQSSKDTKGGEEERKVEYERKDPRAPKMKKDFQIRGLVKKKGPVPKVTIFINGEKVRVEEGISVYEATESFLSDQDRVPTLCYHPYLPCTYSRTGMCGICNVEDAETGEFIRSCHERVREGLKIRTFSKEIEANIKEVLKEKLSNHMLDCPSCPVQGNCVFEKLLKRFDVSVHDLSRKQKELYESNVSMQITRKKEEYQVKNEALIFDDTRCIKCFRCVRVCQHIQGMSKLEVKGEKGVRVFRDLEDYHENMFHSDCIRCGMCSFVCPTGAIVENTELYKLQKFLRQKKELGLTMVVQIAPSIRITFAETLGLPPGSIDERNICTGLRRVGFDYVFDTTFAADLCIMEEGTELLGRVANGGPFPMFTSCCPGWINFVEKHYPEFIPNISSCKSPQAMLGAILKTYWAKKMGLDRKKIYVVSVMPCVGKLSERTRPGIVSDVDMILTTRALGRLFETSKINLAWTLKEEMSSFDDPLGSSSSAGVLFGATGGVMEAALRTAYEVYTKEEFPVPEYKPVRGLMGVKTSQAQLGKEGPILKCTVISGGMNTRRYLEKLKKNEKESEILPEFIEIMICPGGCIGGGGNPKSDKVEILHQRIAAVYPFDRLMNGRRTYRKSHENKQVDDLYKNFLGKPNSPKAKELLHTKYSNKKLGNKDSDQEEEGED